MSAAFRRPALFFSILFIMNILSGCSAAKNTSTAEDVTLTYYHSAPVGDSLKNALQEQTGIKVNFVSMPNYGNDTLDILLSSGSLPDIIEYSWNDYKHSPQWLIDYGYLSELNPLIEEYSPNFKKILDENPMLAKQLQTIRGKYYTYPMLMLDPQLTTGLRGLIIRDDWLSDLGLEAPVTLEDFETVLLAFKKEKNADYPFVVYDGFDSILSAFGIQQSFYLDDGRICYGPYEPAYRDALVLLRRWTQLGLINPDGVMDYSILQQYLISGKSGMSCGYAGSLLGTVNRQLNKQSPDYRFVGISNPVQNEGISPVSYSIRGVFSASAAITASCDKPELAARLLDYGYSEEGQLLYNFGVENVSYTMSDGYPTYTDAVLSGATSIKESMSEYIRANNAGPFLQRREYLEQYYMTREQKKASEIWRSDSDSKLAMPALQLTNEEYEQATAIKNSVNAYAEEMLFKFIIGAESLEGFDGYIKTLEQMDIEKLLSIYQTAYGRYLQNLHISDY